MSRIRIELPANFSFQTRIPVRITDINYGSHMGNDSILSLIHEARMQFLGHYELSELNFGGIGLIMSDVGIEFKNEAYYGDVLIVSVTAVQVSKISFDLFYKLETGSDAPYKVIAIAKTGMVCFNYNQKKIAPIPDAAAVIFKAKTE